LKTAFLTGAAGFLGAHLARILLGEGIGVRALVRKGSDLSNLRGLAVELREGDLLDPEGLSCHLRGADACFHLAAAYSVPDPRDLFRINVDGTRAVLEAALDAGCSILVHTSTVGTLSHPQGGPARECDFKLSETSLPETASSYVKSKLQGEKVALELVASRGAPIVIVHPSAPVGAWDRGPTVTGRRILDVLQGKLPRYIQGAINHVAAKDVARGMLLAARRGRPGGRYLLANGNGNLTRDDFLSLVARVARIKAPRARRRLFFLPRTSRPPAAAKGSPASLSCDPSWSIRELGLPQTPLEEAFGEAVEWFRGCCTELGRTVRK
jgi:dihydroflavonol-4-reductase